VGKGSWQRPTDKEHCNKEALQINDFGRSGCKEGLGVFHPMRDGRCIYCGNDLNAIKRLHAKADKEKDRGQK
jgi:hypothetical protein